jgi:hypothetical protein
MEELSASVHGFTMDLQKLKKQYMTIYYRMFIVPYRGGAKMCSTR